MRKAVWVTAYRQQLGLLMNILKELAELRREYDALGIGDTLSDQDCAEPGFEITAADMKTAVSSVAAINAFITDNWHTTTLYKVIRR